MNLIEKKAKSSEPVSDFMGVIVSDSDAGLVYGVRNNELVHIRSVQSGVACGCVCPECGHPLVARKGSIRAWHFAHAVGPECGTAPETALHMMAKQFLLDRRKLDLPPVIVSDASLCDDELELVGAGRAAASDMGAELAFGDVIPDIWFRDMFGNGFFIEIFVTHGVDAAKIVKLHNLGVPTLEADFSQMDRGLEPEVFEAQAEYVFNHMRWVYHPLINAFHKLSDVERYMRLKRLGERNIRAPKDDICPECHGDLSVYWSDYYDCWIGDCLRCGRGHTADKRIPIWKWAVRDLRICPECGGWMELKNGRYGQFWSCENYPLCTKTLRVDR